MKMPKGERILMLIFLALAAGMAIISLSFNRPEARNFPLITGIATSVIILLYFAVMASPTWSRRLRPFIEDELFLKINAAAEGASEEEIDEAIEDPMAPLNPLSDRARQRRERALVSYIVGLGLLAWLIGLTFAVPVFITWIMIRYSSERPRFAVTVALATTAALYLVFTILLRLPPHFGLLGRFL